MSDELNNGIINGKDAEGQPIDATDSKRREDTVQSEIDAFIKGEREIYDARSLRAENLFEKIIDVRKACGRDKYDNKAEGVGGDDSLVIDISVNNLDFGEDLYIQPQRSKGFGELSIQIESTNHQESQNCKTDEIPSAFDNTPNNSTRYDYFDTKLSDDVTADMPAKQSAATNFITDAHEGNINDCLRDGCSNSELCDDLSDGYYISKKDRSDRAEYRESLLADGAYESERDMALFDEHNQSYHFDAIDSYSRAELTKQISSHYKEESALRRNISKIEARQKNADKEENVSLIVEKISIQKEICELYIELLGSCVYIGAKGKSARYKRNLKQQIDRYNTFCSEYETNTGRPLERLDYGIIDDVLAGRICRPIPNVYYYGMEDDAVYNSYDETNDRIRRLEEEEDIIAREYDRFIEGGAYIVLTDAERRALAKRNTERMSAIRYATERDMLLVGLRSEYALEALEAKRDILVRSYGLDKRKNVKAIRSIEKRISKIHAQTNKAIKFEREDNSRYYLLKMLDPSAEKLKKGARRERLDALRARLGVLLSERESVNERLIALYGGSDKKLKGTKISRKAASVRRRSATSMYKRQRALAKKIDRYRVPADMKERAYELLNKKTAAAATADSCIYKLKRLKPGGRAKKELILEIRRARAEMRRTDKDIKYMLRKLRRNQERYEDKKEWASLIAFLAFIAALGILVWVFFGSDITAYIKELTTQIKGS